MLGIRYIDTLLIEGDSVHYKERSLNFKNPMLSFSWDLSFQISESQVRVRNLLANIFRLNFRCHVVHLKQIFNVK